MEYLPFALIALACPIGMGLMMLVMGRGMMGMGGAGNRNNATNDEPDEPPLDPEKRLAVLQAQRQLLDAQIAAAERTDDSVSQGRVV